MILKTFNFITHIELVIVSREFHLDETYFFSLFLNTLSCHQKYLCGNLFNANKTDMKLPLTLALTSGEHHGHAVMILLINTLTNLVNGSPYNCADIL